jgi:hypothetical protein
MDLHCGGQQNAEYALAGHRIKIGLIGVQSCRFCAPHAVGPHEAMEGVLRAAHGLTLSFLVGAISIGLGVDEPDLSRLILSDATAALKERVRR